MQVNKVTALITAILAAGAVAMPEIQKALATGNRTLGLIMAGAILVTAVCGQLISKAQLPPETK